MERFALVGDQTMSSPSTATAFSPAMSSTQMSLASRNVKLMKPLKIITEVINYRREETTGTVADDKSTGVYNSTLRTKEMDKSGLK